MYRLHNNDVKKVTYVTLLCIEMRKYININHRLLIVEHIQVSKQKRLQNILVIKFYGMNLLESLRSRFLSFFDN